MMERATRPLLQGEASGVTLAARAGLLCLFAALLAAAQGTLPQQRPPGGLRQLTAQEGRAIVVAAREHEPEVRGKPDCSHLVHQVYRLAGFEYPYASSFDLYSGAENFVRVKAPRAGDLITWPGHVGIVLDPVRHTFYSSVRSGMRAEFYDGPYWRARGRPRFYRYLTTRPEKVTLAKATSGVRTPTSERASAEDPASDPAPVGPKPLKREETGSAHEDVPSSDDAPPALSTEIPRSIVIAGIHEKPTRDEAAEGISELSDAAGNVLRGDEPLSPQIPVEIVEQLKVERVETKGGKGWAHVRVDSRASISGGQAVAKTNHEKIRWELRRSDSGWEALMPTEHAYVARDVAVSVLAARLAQISQSEGAKNHDPQVIREEGQLASLLHALLQGK